MEFHKDYVMISPETAEVIIELLAEKLQEEKRVHALLDRSRKECEKLQEVNCKLIEEVKRLVGGDGGE